MIILSEQIFTVRDSGLDPVKKAEIIKLIEQRVDAAIADVFYNVPFLFPLPSVSPPRIREST